MNARAWSSAYAACSLLLATPGRKRATVVTPGGRCRVYPAPQTSPGGRHGARQGQGRIEERQEESPEERQGEAGREEDEEGDPGAGYLRGMTVLSRVPRRACEGTTRRSAG